MPGKEQGLPLTRYEVGVRTLTSAEGTRIIHRTDELSRHGLKPKVIQFSLAENARIYVMTHGGVTSEFAAAYFVLDLPLTEDLKQLGYSAPQSWHKLFSQIIIRGGEVNMIDMIGGINKSKPGELRTPVRLTETRLYPDLFVDKQAEYNAKISQELDRRRGYDNVRLVLDTTKNPNVPIVTFEHTTRLNDEEIINTSIQFDRSPGSNWISRDLIDSDRFPRELRDAS